MVYAELLESCILRECFTLSEQAARPFNGPESYRAFIERLTLIQGLTLDLAAVNKIDLSSYVNYIRPVIDEVTPNGIHIHSGGWDRAQQRHELCER